MRDRHDKNAIVSSAIDDPKWKFLEREFAMDSVATCQLTRIRDDPVQSRVDSGCKAGGSL
jgi:hypothetical protein